MSATEVVPVPADKPSSQSFTFKVAGRVGFTIGHSTARVTLVLTSGDVFGGVTFTLGSMTSDEARSIANSLYEAAEYADKALPIVTGEAA